MDIPLTIEKSGETVLSDGRIHCTHYGAPFGYHRTLSKSGTGANTNADLLKGDPLHSTLPNLVFSTERKVTITDAALSSGITGVIYKATLSATGGTAPYTWAKVSGNLPDGLTLSEAGVISGTPTKEGAFSFTVSATDKSGSKDEASLSITITAAGAPGKPTSLKVEPGNGSVTLTWDAPSSDGGEAITKYEVKIGDDETWATAAGKSHTFSGLTNGTLYTFSVRAVNAKGAGEAATMTAKPVAPNVGSDPNTDTGNTSSGSEAVHAVVIDVTETVVEDGITTAIAPTVTIDDIEEAVTKATAAGGDAKPTIVIDASGSKAAKIPEGTIELLLAADTPDVDVPIVLDDGEVTLNKAAAEKLKDAAESAGVDLKDVKLAIIPDIDKDTDGDTLTPTQEAAIENDEQVRLVYDVSYQASGITLEIGGLSGEDKILVGLDYTLRADEKPGGVLVKHFPENGGAPEKMTEGRRYSSGKAWFRTSHLSVYAVAYDPSLVTDTSDEKEDDENLQYSNRSGSGGGCGTGMIGMFAVLALAAAIARKHRAV
jgi:hypothetical protein